MATKVPLLDLHAQYAPLRDEILAAMTRVADSQRFIMGPEVEALEADLRARLESRALTFAREIMVETQSFSTMDDVLRRARVQV